MGWKSVKEHYRIEHLVSVTEKGICIGSAYTPDIMIISFDGALIKDYTSNKNLYLNEELMRYEREMVADPEMLKKLVMQQDTFEVSTKVYTYCGADIIEKECEALGWPNVTHDGEVMYDNKFSENRQEVIQWALSNAQRSIPHQEKLVRDTKKELAEYEAHLKELYADQEALKKELAKSAPAGPDLPADVSP